MPCASLAALGPVAGLFSRSRRSTFVAGKIAADRCCNPLASAQLPQALMPVAGLPALCPSRLPFSQEVDAQRRFRIVSGLMLEPLGCFVATNVERRLRDKSPATGPSAASDAHGKNRVPHWY